MKKNYWSLVRSASVFLLLLMTFAAYAQRKVVTGTITDTGGSPIPGVNVVIKGTTLGAASDANGVFSIEADEQDVLVVSFIGYASQEIKVGNQTKITVQMNEDVATLEEVVVTGYGEMRKADLTAAQTSISSKDMERTVNTTIEQAIQGRSAGVYVTQNTGAPGGGISVNIRGINTLSGSNEPLYVVDGIQIPGSGSASGSNPLSSLNPTDILSMDILQGPSATAIYGSRGTNGVVLITTKRGKSGDVKISYALTYSVQTAPKEQDVMNLQQYAQMENEYKAIAGGDVREDFLDPSILGEGTNWQKELFSSAAMQKHQISVSGGSEKTNFYLSGERMDQDGVALGSGFDRTSVRLNLDSKARDWFTIGVNLNYAQTMEKLGSNNLNGNNLIVNAIQMGPQIPVQNLDGTYGGGNPNNNAEQFAPPNPIGIAEISTNELERRRLLGGMTAGFKIIEGLEFRTSFNTDIGFSNSTYFLPTYNFGWQQNTNAYLENNDNLNTYWNWNQMLQYNKQLGKHHINAMATHEAQESTWKGLKGSRSGFLTNEVLDLNAGNAATAGNGGGHGSWAMESYLGRLNYNFDDRYIVTAAFRADGSANFGPGKKWGYFPSIAGAWRISGENFFKVQAVSDLRLRYETGLTGNQGDGGQVIYGTFADALPTEWGSGFRPDKYPNPNFQWEETSTNNIGLTLGLFSNRITLDADFYIKKTDNLILQSELPWYMGTVGDAAVRSPVVNVGSLENKGWGFSINTKNINKNGFKWDSNLNMSGFKTEITSLSSGASHITKEGPDWFLTNFAQRSQVGYAPLLFLGYIEEGIFQSVEEVAASARPVDNTGNVRPVGENSIWVGDVKYKDVSGPEGIPDGKITADDRTIMGNPYPKFFGGFTNTFSYKGFDVSILMTFSYGNEVYNYLRYQNNNPNNINLGRNMFIEASDYARVALDDGGNPYLLNPETEINRISTSSVNGNYDRLTNKYLEDGSYLRVKNISVNYNVPSSLLSKLKVVRGVRVGVSMQNVFTFTKYSGYDPEIGSYVGPNANVAAGFIGVDYGRYPLTPVYAFNFGIEF
jgi:TonB-dependent starch-binding outer membrane protein SusC